MMLSLSLVFNVVLVVMVVSLFKKWWEADDDFEGCERQLEKCERQLEKCEECLGEWQEAYRSLQEAYRSLQSDYYYLEEDLFDAEAEFEEFQDRTVKAFKQLKNEIQDRDDVIDALYEEIDELETYESEVVEINDDEYEVMPEILFLMAPVLTEAEQIIEDAKIVAEKIVAEAKVKAEQIIASAEIKIKEMLSKVNKCKKPTNKPVPPQVSKSSDTKRRKVGERPTPPQVSVKDPNKEYKKPTGKPVKPTITKAV